MINHKQCLRIFIVTTALLFIINSCSNIPLIGKKKEEKTEKLPEGKTVTVEGMEKIKAINPPKAETPPPKKNPAQPTLPTRETEMKVASKPTRPFSSSSPLLP
jgi:hypothetical protein